MFVIVLDYEIHVIIIYCALSSKVWIWIIIWLFI